MVKLKGPSFATAASGTLADALTFSNSRGRPYLRKRPTPKNPQSPLQTAARAIWSFLSEQWVNVVPAYRLTWEEPAEQAKISPFNFYMKYNAARWKTGRPPSQAYPSPDSNGFATWGQLPTIYDSVNSIHYWWRMNYHPNAWGIALYLSPTPAFPKDNTTLIKVHITTPTTTNFHYYQSPVTPGTYWASARQFTETGTIQAAVAETSADSLPA